jgi:hypothetical protein
MSEEPDIKLELESGEEALFYSTEGAARYLGVS